jgi:hypothetical protein
MSGWSRRRFAEQLGIHWTTLHRYLNGSSAIPIPIALAVERLELYSSLETRAGGDGVREEAVAYTPSQALRTPLSEAEKQRVVKEIIEISDLMKRLPRIGPLSDEELLGYGEEDAQ